jgi:Tol biopolymer transport system component
VITGYKYALERRAYPDGQPEPIADDAIWPRLSPDGTRLAYVFYSLTDARAELRVADADGQNSTALPLPASFIAVDVPMFTPDGQALLFSGSDTAGPASVSWFDEMLGVQRAEAHSLPSDWYRMSLSGGAPERLTHIQDTGLYGGLSPDGRRLAFIAATGVYVMNLDGSQLTPLLNIPAFGTMDWAR